MSRLILWHGQAGNAKVIEPADELEVGPVEVRIEVLEDGGAVLILSQEDAGLVCVEVPHSDLADALGLTSWDVDPSIYGGWARATGAAAGGGS